MLPDAFSPTGKHGMGEDEGEKQDSPETPVMPADVLPGRNEAQEVQAEGAPDPAGEGTDPKPRRNITKKEFRAILEACEGNIAMVMHGTGLTRLNVRERIQKDAELRDIYGSREAPGSELAIAVTREDMDTYRAALKMFGVSDRHIEKLRALDGLAGNGDRLLAISFKVSHQSYVGSLHNLDEVGSAIKDRLDGDVHEDGTRTPLSHKDFAALSKVYVDYVKERGNGMGIIQSGVEAIVRMSAAAKGDGPGDAVTTKPGWGKMKKVRPPEKDREPDAEV